MRYLGGKQQIGKTIAEYINSIMDLDGLESYCEPFCGMVGVGRNVRAKTRVFSDAHEDLVLFLQAIRDGWHPPKTLSKEEYQLLRKSENPSALRAFAGFGCSFGGKWFGGYAKEGYRDYPGSQAKDARKLGGQLAGSIIENHQYYLTGQSDCTYCDPPYSGTTSYGGVGGFDSEKFWEWVRNRDGIILVSEYEGPEWADCIWEKQVKCTIKKDATTKSPDNTRVEKLFLIDNS